MDRYSIIHTTGPGVSPHFPTYMPTCTQSISISTDAAHQLVKFLFQNIPSSPNHTSKHTHLPTLLYLITLTRVPPSGKQVGSMERRITMKLEHIGGGGGDDEMSDQFCIGRGHHGCSQSTPRRIQSNNPKKKKKREERRYYSWSRFFFLFPERIRVVLIITTSVHTDPRQQHQKSHVFFSFQIISTLRSFLFISVHH